MDERSARRYSHRYCVPDKTLCTRSGVWNRENVSRVYLVFKESTERNAWIRSVLIVANGRSFTTIIWWSSCMASIIWWKRDFFVASGVVPYCEGELEVVELSLSVTRISTRKFSSSHVRKFDWTYTKLSVVDGISVCRHFESFVSNYLIYVSIDYYSVFEVHSLD